MGHLQSGTVTKKGEIPYIPKHPHLPPFKYGPHLLPHCRQSLLCCPACRSLAAYSVNFFVLCSTSGESFHCRKGLGGSFHPTWLPHIWGSPSNGRDTTNNKKTKKWEKHPNKHFSKTTYKWPTSTLILNIIINQRNTNQYHSDVSLHTH